MSTSTDEFSLRPIPFSLAACCGRGRIFDLESVIDAARAVVRTEPLRDHALTAERACLFEDDSAGAVIVLLEDDAVTLPKQQIGQGALCAARS